MKIGVFGGSFNPIHIGHAIVANYLSQTGCFDEVWLMPSRINPLKQSGERPMSGQERLEMCRLVARRCAAVKVSDIEMTLPEPSYTYVTLCALRRRYPQHQFRLIIGADNWEIFHQWREWEKIIGEFGVVIYPRPGYDIKGELPPNVAVAKEGPQAFVSSTMIREMMGKGMNVNFLLPSDVIHFVKCKV